MTGIFLTVMRRLLHIIKYPVSCTNMKGPAAGLIAYAILSPALCATLLVMSAICAAEDFDWSDSCYCPQTKLPKKCRPSGYFCALSGLVPTGRCVVEMRAALHVKKQLSCVPEVKQVFKTCNNGPVEDCNDVKTEVRIPKCAWTDDGDCLAVALSREEWPCSDATFIEGQDGTRSIKGGSPCEDCKDQSACSSQNCRYYTIKHEPQDPINGTACTDKVETTSPCTWRSAPKEPTVQPDPQSPDGDPPNGPSSDENNPPKDMDPEY
jgi:hypothetical protein